MTMTDRVLARLQFIDRTDDGHESATEIAEVLKVSTTTTRAALGRLEADGRAQKSGISSTGARTWTVTDAGRTTTNGA